MTFEGREGDPLLCLVDLHGQNVPDGGGGLVNAQQRGQGGGDVYRGDAVVIGSGDERGAEEGERTWRS